MNDDAIIIIINICVIKITWQILQIASMPEYHYGSTIRMEENVACILLMLQM